MPFLDRLKTRVRRPGGGDREQPSLTGQEVDAALAALDDRTEPARLKAVALAVAERGDAEALRRIFALPQLAAMRPERADWLARHCLERSLTTVDGAEARLALLAALDFLPLTDAGKPARLFRQAFRDHLQNLEPAAATEWALGLPDSLAIDGAWPVFRLLALDRHGAPFSYDDLESARAAIDGKGALSRQEIEFVALAVARGGETGALGEIFSRPEIRGLGAERADQLAKLCLQKVLDCAEEPDEKMARLSELQFLPLAEGDHLARQYRQIFRDRLRSLDPSDAADWLSALPRSLPFDPDWPPFVRLKLRGSGLAVPDDWPVGDRAARAGAKAGGGGLQALASRMWSRLRTLRERLPHRLSLREVEVMALAEASRGDPQAVRRIFSRAAVKKLSPDRLDWLARHSLHRGLMSATGPDQKLAVLSGLDFLPLADSGRLARTYRITFRNHVQSLEPDAATSWTASLPDSLPFDATWPIYRLAMLDSQGAPSTDADLEEAVAAVEKNPDLSLADLAYVCGVLYSRRAMDHLERWKARALAQASEPSLDLAQLHLNVTDRAAALEVADRVLESAPGDAATLLFKARLLQTMNKTETAVSIYQELLAANPELVAAQGGVLSAFRAMGRPEDDLLRKIDDWVDLEADADKRHRSRMALLLVGRMAHRAFLEAWEYCQERGWPADALLDVGRSLSVLGEKALAENFLRQAGRTRDLNAADELVLGQAARLRELFGVERMTGEEASSTCTALAAILSDGARHEEILDAATARHRLRVPESLMTLAGELAAPLHAESGPICLVTSTLGPGGAERQLIYTACGLRDQLGDDAELYVLCGRLDERQNSAFFLASLEEAEVPVIRPTSRPSKATADLDPRIQRGISQLLGLWPREAGREQLAGYYRFFVEHKPGIVHAWQDETMVVAGFAALLAGVPRIVLSGQSLNPHHRPHRATYLRAGLKLLSEYEQVHLTVNSATGARDYAEWLDYPFERITVLHNGLSLAEIDAHLETRTVAGLKSELGIPAGVPVVGAVMRQTEEKRPNLCLDILLHLLERVPDCHAMMIGDGPMWEEVSSRGLASPVGDRLRFPGVISPVEPWMAAMDLLLLTSAIEGLPNVLIEAQYAGTPVVATDAGGAKEAFVEGRTGYQFANEEPQEMAEMLAGLLADRESLAVASEAARAHVRREFSAERMIDTTLKAFGLRS